MPIRVPVEGYRVGQAAFDPLSAALSDPAWLGLCFFIPKRTCLTPYPNL